MYYPQWKRQGSSHNAPVPIGGRLDVHRHRSEPVVAKENPFAPTVGRAPDRPARTDSFYRLCYSSSHLFVSISHRMLGYCSEIENYHFVQISSCLLNKLHNEANVSQPIKNFISLCWNLLFTKGCHWSKSWAKYSQFSYLHYSWWAAVSTSHIHIHIKRNSVLCGHSE
jgi:hypothetical protein